MIEHRIVFISPAGTTAQTAEMIAQALSRHQVPVQVISLNHQRQALKCRALFHDWPERCCLWIGTPVYCDHTVPIIDEFIEALPDGRSGYSVPFATWGGVTSGTTLMELHQQLATQRYPAIAAAKILAVHSSMWQCPEPLAAGHPDHEDNILIRRLVEQVLNNLGCQEPSKLSLKALDYLSDLLKEDAANKSLAKVKAASAHPQATADLCDGCGYCAENCPMDAITMETTPRVSDDCIRCMQCVRCCPNQAFPFNQELFESKIRAMRSQSDEVMISEIYY